MTAGAPQVTAPCAPPRSAPVRRRDRVTPPHAATASHSHLLSQSGPRASRDPLRPSGPRSPGKPGRACRRGAGASPRPRSCGAPTAGELRQSRLPRLRKETQVVGQKTNPKLDLPWRLAEAPWCPSVRSTRADTREHTSTPRGLGLQLLARDAHSPPDPSRSGAHSAHCRGASAGAPRWAESSSCELPPIVDSKVFAVDVRLLGVGAFRPFGQELDPSRITWVRAGN